MEKKIREKIHYPLVIFFAVINSMTLIVYLTTLNYTSDFAYFFIFGFVLIMTTITFYRNFLNKQIDNYMIFIATVMYVANVFVIGFILDNHVKNFKIESYIFFTLPGLLVFDLLVISFYKLINWLDIVKLDYHKSFAYLAVYVIKADSEIKKVEKAKFKQFVKKKVPKSQQDEVLDLFNKAFDSQYTITQICKSVRLKSKAEYINLVYRLYGIAFADKTLSIEEDKLITKIAYLLNLTKIQVKRIKAMYEKRFSEKNKNKEEYQKEKSQTKTKEFANYQLINALKILGLNQDANTIQIKKAYRRLVKMHHPDKFAKFGAEAMENAEYMFREVQQAYEYLEKSGKI